MTIVRRIHVLLVFISIVLLPSSEAGSSTTISLYSDVPPECSGEFTLTDVSFDCSDSYGECSPGTEVSITGELEMASEGGLYSSSSSVNVEVYWCVYSIFCSVAQSSTSVNFCKYVEPLDGQTCAADGSYTFQTTFTLPSDISRAGYWVTIMVLLEGANGDDDDNDGGGDWYTVCDANVLVNESTMYTMGSVIGLTIVAGVAYGIRRRRKSRRRLVLLATEEEEVNNNNSSSDDAAITTGFEMMKDPVVRQKTTTRTIV